MYVRRTALIPKYVKGGSNIFTNAFKKVKKTFKRYMPLVLDFAKRKGLDFAKTEGLKLAKKQAPKLMEKGGDKLLKMAMSKISNLAGGNIIPVVKPTINAGKGIKYI